MYTLEKKIGKKLRKQLLLLPKVQGCSASDGMNVCKCLHLEKFEVKQFSHVSDTKSVQNIKKPS